MNILRTQKMRIIWADEDGATRHVSQISPSSKWQIAVLAVTSMAEDRTNGCIDLSVKSCWRASREEYACCRIEFHLRKLTNRFVTEMLQ